MRLSRRGILLISISAAWLLAGTLGCGSKKKEWPTPAANSAIVEARRLLTAAGYEFGNDFPAAELLYNTNEDHKKIAAAVQDMWRANLGIEVRLRNSDWRVYLDQLTRLNYQIARRGWIGDYPDPNTFIDLFKTDSGNSNTGWSNVEYDRLVAEAIRTEDTKARLELLEKAEAILMRELPVVPVYFYVSQGMWRPALKGVYDNALNVHPLKEILLDDGSKPLVWNAGAEPQTLDPNLQRGQVEHRINIALFEGLTVYDPQTLEPRPGVAESWTRSPDARIWTFNLRGSKWTNGNPVTAQDFVYGWKRQIDPALGSDYSNIVYDYVKNGRPYYDGAAADAKLKEFTALDDAKRGEAAEALAKQAQPRHAALLKALVESEKKAEIQSNLKKALAEGAQRKDVRLDDVGVRAQDERTLVVELESPTPYFLYLTSFFCYYPIPREAVEKHGDKWTRPENIVTNGPFRMKEWVVNSHILVELNPDYWDAEKVRQQQIRFLPHDNVNTAFTMFKAGQCDYIDTVPSQFVDALKKDPDFHSVPILTTYFYSFNTKRKPFDDPRVRRALALAIDRETICDKILKGGQTPAYSIVPPSLAGYRSQRFAGPGAGR